MKRIKLLLLFCLSTIYSINMFSQNQEDSINIKLASLDQKTLANIGKLSNTLSRLSLGGYGEIAMQRIIKTTKVMEGSIYHT